MIFQRLFMGLFVGVLAFVGTAEAKDLTHRLGVGVKNNTSFDLPSLAAVYYPNADLGLTGGIGIDTQKNESKLGLTVGLRRLLFREDNLNFYFGGQAGLINFEVASQKESGFELNAVFGAEFFLPGLESLGFSFEGGVGITSVEDTRFRTIADHPFRASMIFYF